jgi:ribosome-associated translation inhibitor RaiA
MDNFQIKGLEELNEGERKELQEILKRSYEKLKRKTKIDFDLKVSIKAYSKDKENLVKRKKYSIQATITGTIRQFDASADDWDLKKVVHKVMNALETEIEHAFHSSEQHK